MSARGPSAPRPQPDKDGRAMGLAIGDGRLIATGKRGKLGGQWHGRADRPRLRDPPSPRTSADHPGSTSGQLGDNLIMIDTGRLRDLAVPGEWPRSNLSFAKTPSVAK